MHACIASDWVNTDRQAQAIPVEMAWDDCMQNENVLVLLSHSEGSPSLAQPDRLPFVFLSNGIL